MYISFRRLIGINKYLSDFIVLLILIQVIKDVGKTGDSQKPETVKFGKTDVMAESLPDGPVTDP